MIDEEEKEIVIARLETMPPDMRLSIGGHGSFDKDQLIDNVKKETKIGEFVVKVYMKHIRSFSQV